MMHTASLSPLINARTRQNDSTGNPHPIDCPLGRSICLQPGFFIRESIAFSKFLFNLKYAINYNGISDKEIRNCKPFLIMKTYLQRFFKLNENNTNLRKEMIGGATTFLTMSYIVIVHPNMLSETGMDHQALITITCLAAFIGTLLAGIWGKLPLAMAPGMGLNAFFTYSLVINHNVPWQTALGVVFLSGIFFLLLTVLGIREKIIHGIPNNLKIAVAVGIGLFLAFIGFKNMGLIIPDETSIIKIGTLNRTVLLSLGGLMLIIVLEIKKVRASILIGILAVFAISIIAGDVPMPDRWLSNVPDPTPVLFKLDIAGALNLALIGSIFSFMFVDLFDSLGTILACAYEAGFVKKDGTIKNLNRILEADAVATVLGSLLGTSTTTTFVESASGIAAGARTGLSSIVTSLFFLLTLFLAPVIVMVPGYATAPALIVVGVYLFKTIDKMTFDSFQETLPAFLTIFLMPFTSISTGISFGFASYVLIALITFRRIPLITWIIGILSILNMVFGGI
jgi:AGZA family xanthine/uracil permease-like MFS transporter